MRHHTSLICDIFSYYYLRVCLVIEKFEVKYMGKKIKRKNIRKKGKIKYE